MLRAVALIERRIDEHVLHLGHKMPGILAGRFADDTDRVSACRLKPSLIVEAVGKASPSKQIDHAGIANDDLDRDGGRDKSEMPEYPAQDGGGRDATVRKEVAADFLADA